jgi:superfamily II DNA or RNA helicase
VQTQLERERVIVPNIFQREALNRLESTNEKKGIIVMPTGTGKTFLAALWFKKKLEFNPDAKLLFICHNNDILSQANEKEFQKCLKDLDIDFSYYNASEKKMNQCVFGTVQTLFRNLDKFNKDYFDYIIVDEAHHYKAKTFEVVIEHFTPKFLLGLTATPYRLDRKNIFDVCGIILYEAKANIAIKKGLLTKINYFCVDNDIDFSNIKWNGNDYDEKDLNRKICIEEYDRAIFKEYMETAKRRFQRKKTICFCATVEHAHRMARIFNKNGISAVALTGKNRLKEDLYPRSERKKIIEDFRNGKYEIIFVRDLFNEGVDIPDADCIMMLRPTRSHVIFTQQIGRGLRTSEGKENVLILDFTGNCRRCIINFEVLGEMIELNIIEKMSLENDNSFNKNEIVYINNGSIVRLTRKKINIVKMNFYIKERYSLENLRKTFLELKTNLGKNPTNYDFAKVGIHFSRIKDLYGSWNNFLRAIGERPIRNLTEEENKKKITEEYYELKNKLGRQPKSEEMATTTLYRYFASWSDFLRGLGEPIRENHDRVSKKELIKEYFRLKDKLGRQPLMRDFKLKYNNGVKFSAKKYLHEFGTWSDFLKEINEPMNQWNVSAKDVTKKELIDNYFDLKKKLNKHIGQEELQIKNGSKFGNGKYISKFGSMRSFFKIIKEPYTFPGYITKEFLIKELRKKANELGRIPSTEEFGNRYSQFLNYYDSWDSAIKDVFSENYFKNDIKIVPNYKPKIKLEASSRKRNSFVTQSHIGKNWKGYQYKSTREKKELREKIIAKIEDGDNVLLLESPELSAIREIEKQNKKPSKIIIPNHLEFDKVSKALQNMKFKINSKIELINTSVLQYLLDSEERFDFIWLDYCGAFSYYMKDLDILFQKHFKNIRLILSYNLFDPIKNDQSYYFTRVIDYVLEKINGKGNVRLLKDITYRYKRTMYNIGFEIEPLKR